MNRRFKSMTAFIAVLAFAGAAFADTRRAIDEQKVEEIIKMTTLSVVRVEVRETGLRKIATGVVIDKDGTIVTTALISPRDQKIQIVTSAGKVHQAVFKGFDTQTGIAVIQAKDAALTPLVLGRTADLRPGVWIGVVGLSPENSPAITQGIVSSTSQDRARLNIWVVPGSSGAPVVSADGKMVGVLRGAYFDEAPVAFEFREGTTVGSGIAISRGESPSAGLAVAVPIDLVVSVVGDIRKSGKVLRGWLGVSVDESEGRLEVAEVETKSPAEAAKIKVGDVIVAIEGKDLPNGSALSQEVRSRKPGTEVVLKIERDGKPVDVKVKLAEYSEADAKRELEVLFPRLFPQNVPRGADKNLGRTPPPNFQEFRYERRKYIGVSLEEMNPELAEAWGAKDGYGLLVTSLEAEGAAKKAGVKVGDIILKADGKKVETVSGLSGLLQEKKKGDKVRIELVRDKKPLTVDVEVAEDETSPAFMYRSNRGGDPEKLSEEESRVWKQLEGDFLNLRKGVPLNVSPDLGKIMRARGIVTWI